MDDIIHALQCLRVPVGQGEYDIHALVLDALWAHGIQVLHEVKLGPGRRIDFMCGTIGIEIKRGRPSAFKLLPQIEKYVASDQLSALILVVEKNAAVPNFVLGKPVRLVSLNKLWGISL